MMAYTVIFEGEVFYTEWFDTENNWRDTMIVINNISNCFTKDGKHWEDIPFDHL